MILYTMKKQLLISKSYQVEDVCKITKIIPDQSVDLNYIWIAKKIANFSDKENFFVYLMDEIKILNQNVDLGDIELKYAILQKASDIASHVLVFLLRSIVKPFKFSSANFATYGPTASQMFPLFW